MSLIMKNLADWKKSRIKPEEIDKYLNKGRSFIDQEKILSLISQKKKVSRLRINEILAKSLSIQTLELDEVADLLSIDDPEVLSRMQEVALTVKKKVYDNRIVTFAPLYLGNFCVNDCLYCGFRSSNDKAIRKVLDMQEIEKETRYLCGQIGHKRLIVVYGEHPYNDLNYMIETIRTIYNIKEKTRKGFGQIRRVNVNAAPLSIEELKQLRKVGIGTYQVFQETYHRPTYARVHPAGTIKSDYLWRLYSMHRAFEAGIDDVGLGALFGLYDYKYEVMGLAAHNRELENKFGVGAHTISFPRLEPALNTPFIQQSRHKVNDDDFIKLMTVIRLSVPHTGMIITCRETPQMKKKSLSLGITQTDASTKIGVGSYSDSESGQKGERQQFILADTRSLEEMISEFARMGYITSFCTAGYRCGRTGECIMDLLKRGEEGKLCKLNAVLTFREWIDDFASQETKSLAEPLIEKEINEIKKIMPKTFERFDNYYSRVKNGERDLYF
ncbi:MAG: [FeFe] hydrogenase H-cluster radical SAM maturase HydG [Candidatus Omnitrophica bacterium]|nr:[FeFe] hydrogenase H-cluster radical SAM maturase HydG [Candidatus Omnitrophota bacterium]